ncbi:MAG: glycogen-binding domain-containing protein [bacterium]
MQKTKVAKKAAKPAAKTAAKPAARKTARPASRTASKKVLFRFAAPPGCQVFVAGTFNGWSADEHELTHDARSGFFQSTITLATGRYEYKFVVGGTWVADPACPDWVPNEHGSLNSVIII